MNIYHIVDICFNKQEVNLINEENPKVSWYFDLSISNHVIGNKAIFFNIKSSNKLKICSTRGQRHLKIHVDNQSIKINLNEIKTIKDILFLSKIIKNLNSINYIIDKNLSLEFVNK